MEKQSKGKTTTRAKAGGKKEIETPVQGSPTWNLLGAMAIAMAAIMIFGIGYLIGAKSIKQGGNIVMNVNEELARVTVTAEEDGDWEFSVADGKVLEYAGKTAEQIYMTEEDEKEEETTSGETVSADAVADLSDDDYQNASDTSSNAKGYRKTFYFRGVNKGETTVTMSYRKNGTIEKTKAFVVSVNGDLKATVKE